MSRASGSPGRFSSTTCKPSIRPDRLSDATSSVTTSPWYGRSREWSGLVWAFYHHHHRHQHHFTIIIMELVSLKESGMGCNQVLALSRGETSKTAVLYPSRGMGWTVAHKQPGGHGGTATSTARFPLPPPPPLSTTPTRPTTSTTFLAWSPNTCRIRKKGSYDHG